MMNKKVIYITMSLAFSMLNYSQLRAQADIPIPEGASSRYIRIAEIGELTDSVNVWGDVTSAGRYIIPEGTTLPELVSFSLGYASEQRQIANSNWGKTEIELKVSRYDANKKKVNVANFKYHFNQPEPVGMFEFGLQNNDIVTLQVRRKPSFGDYVGVIAPVIGVIATSVLLVQNLKQ